MILAIDPGCTESAYVILDRNLKPVEFDKIENTWLLPKLLDDEFTRKFQHFAIEMVASYGMPVGKEVFETCVWIGKFDQALFGKNKTRVFIYRKTDVCMNLCHTTKAKDANIRQALIDRFARHDFKSGKGTKKNPDWFYGFKEDIWSAYAIGITYADLYLSK